MGDRGVDVNRGQSGRHRAETRIEVRRQASDLLDLLATLQSTLDGASRSGDRAGTRAAVAGRVACWMALADLAEELHPAYALACRRVARVEGEVLPRPRDGQDGPVAEGRHSATGRAAGTVSVGRHAAERKAPDGPSTRGGRHWAPDEEAGAAPLGPIGARRSSVAALLQRALLHETPVSALVSSPRAPRREVVAVTGPADDVDQVDDIDDIHDVADRWAVEQWLPSQRRGGPGEQAGWHPVPRPRPSTSDGAVNPVVPPIVDRLAG